MNSVEDYASILLILLIHSDKVSSSSFSYLTHRLAQSSTEWDTLLTILLELFPPDSRGRAVRCGPQMMM